MREISSKRILSDGIGRLSTQQWGLIFFAWGVITAPLIAALAPATLFWSGAFWGAVISVIFGLAMLVRWGHTQEVAI